MEDRHTEPLGPDAAPIQDALNRVGRRLNVHDVAALKELDTAFREWAEGKGALLWAEDIRLARAVAAVLHVELVEADDAEE